MCFLVKRICYIASARNKTCFPSYKYESLEESIFLGGNLFPVTHFEICFPFCLYLYFFRTLFVCAIMQDLQPNTLWCLYILP
jgi:hypothetical protein